MNSPGAMPKFAKSEKHLLSRTTRI
jgi:hypothetical protein